MNGDYISRADAIKKLCEYGFGCGDARIKGVVNTIPAADVRPVVLCRDCKHRDPEDHKCDCGGLERAGCIFPTDDNYFCAHGERKEADHEP